MVSGNVETYFRDGAWSNRIEGGADVGGAFHLRTVAVWAGRMLAREHGVVHVIRDADGRVVETNSYEDSRASTA